MTQHSLLRACNIAVLALCACGFETAPAKTVPIDGAPVAGRESTTPVKPVMPPQAAEPTAPELEPDSVPKPEQEKPGATPTVTKPDAPADCASCDDQDVCTTDVVVSRAGSCRCVHDTIVDAIDGDGCCPQGATDLDDLDCGASVQAECGNGRLDAGEQCDGGARCAVDCTLLFNAALAHRYSFDGTARTLVDSVGNKDGSVPKGMLGGEGELELSGFPENTYAQLPTGLISGLTSVTIEVWATIQRGGGGQRLFDFGNEGSFGQPTTYLALTPTSLADGRAAVLLNVTPEADGSLTDTYLPSRADVSTNRLHGFTVVFDGPGRTLSLYIDGALEGSRPITGRLSDIDDGRMWIGRSQYDEYPYFQGSISELRIYKAALTRAEVAASYKAGPDPAAAPAGATATPATP